MKYIDKRQMDDVKVQQKLLVKSIMMDKDPSARFIAKMLAVLYHDIKLIFMNTFYRGGPLL